MIGAQVHAIGVRATARSRAVGPLVLALASLLPAACASPSPLPVAATRVNEEFEVQGPAWRDAVPPAAASSVIRNDVSEQFRLEWLAANNPRGYLPARSVASPEADGEYVPVSEGGGYHDGWGCRGRERVFPLPLNVSFGWFGGHGHGHGHGSSFGISTGFPLYW